VTPRPRTPEGPDADLVARARAGDRAAFASLYERHRDFCFAVAVRTVGDRDLAAEAVQEAFLQWLHRLDAFVLAPGTSVRSYLYPTVRHVAIRLRERRDRRPEPQRATGGIDAWVADTPAEAAETARTLRRAIGLLPESQREVLILRLIDGLTVEETALAMGVAPGTVKSRLSLALARLRQDAELRGEDPGAG
jgi:RNA polymerase sigma-70 factor (ECF subfamily)